MTRVLVAGATGALGRYVTEVLERRGYFVRAIGRNPESLRRLRADEVVRADLTRPATLRDVCRGVDAVVSCAGASMRLGGLGDRRGFSEVDHRGNLELLREARDAGVGRMVYVSLFGGRELMHTEYARAHERFVDALAASGLPYAVVRPTGYFSFLGEILRMAGKGRGAVFGPGDARTNPVHEADVAEACVDALEGGEREVEVGGPEVLTRRGIVELAFDVAGRPARVTGVPPGLVRALAAPVRLVNPRIHALLHFGVEVSLVDAVAPAVGTRDLRSYFEALHAASAPTRRPVPGARFRSPQDTVD